MITVFVAPFTPPTLPDLYVKDSLSSLNKPVGGLDGWDGDYLQAQTLTFAPLSFLDLGSFTSNGDTNSVWCRRLFKGLANLAFSDVGATVNIRIVAWDSDLNEMVSDTIAVTAGTRINSDGYYMAPVYEFPLNGASRIGLALDTISAGTVYVKLAGV